MKDFNKERAEVNTYKYNNILIINFKLTFIKIKTKSVNKAIGYMFGWARAMYDFYNVFTNT